MNRLAWLTFRAVSKHYHVKQFTTYKTRRCQRVSDFRQIDSPHEQVDVARISHRPLVDRRDPGGDSIASHDSVRNASLVECRRGPEQSLAHLGHRSLHSVEDVHAHGDRPGRPARAVILGWMIW